MTGRPSYKDLEKRITLLENELIKCKLEKEANQENKYRLIAENTADLISILDMNLRFTYVSPASMRIRGFTVEEAMEQVLDQVLTPVSLQLSIDVFEKEMQREASGAADPNRTLVLELEEYKKDGTTIWVEVNLSFLRDRDNRPVEILIVSRDITDRKRAEAEREKRQEQLIQAQKMESLGLLAGGIAHDFNNILASMMGFTEMAVRETRQKVRGNHLGQVLKACERAKNLVNQIMTFSRNREQKFGPLDIKMILNEAIGLLRATLPATIEIRQDITQEDVCILADSTQIHQVIMNLCTNASHAMREKGGLLNIHLSNIEIIHPMLAPYPDLPVGPYVRLSIPDNGHGIDAAIKGKIFDPFFTTKQSREGTGLGLSVVYGIIKSCGGVIDVQSTVGKGTAFTICLPRITSESSVAEAIQDDIDLKGQERILFVDDEEMLVKMAGLYFQYLGYSVTATTSSSEALRLFQLNPHSIDLVITDMTMPQMTGAELSQALLKIRSDLPIILCTGDGDLVKVEAVRKVNIREFILKPISLNNLGVVVRRVLGKEDKLG